MGDFGGWSLWRSKPFVVHGKNSYYFVCAFMVKPLHLLR